VDLCQSIVIVPSDDFEVNPEISNPFKLSSNPGFMLKEEIFVPDGNVLVCEIPFKSQTFNDYDFMKIAKSSDYSKFLPQVNINIEYEEF
jgi:hypothetical protein